MPPNGNVVQVFEEVYSKSVDQACMVTPVGMLGGQKDRIRQDLPWLIKTAAYTPIVVFAFGTKLVLMVAAVEMKVAHAKLWDCVSIPHDIADTFEEEGKT